MSGKVEVHLRLMGHEVGGRRRTERWRRWALGRLARDIAGLHRHRRSWGTGTRIRVRRPEFLLGAPGAVIVGHEVP